jgi:signal transduction histidine kinase
MSSRAFRTYAGVPVIPLRMLSTAGRTWVTGGLAGRDRDAGTDAELEIADNGRGLAGPHAPGVGYTSMRERAAELGGTLDIRSAGRGTVCRARLPLLGISEGNQGVV